MPPENTPDQMKVCVVRTTGKSLACSGHRRRILRPTGLHLLAVSALVAIYGCVNSGKQETSFQPCTDEWFQIAEARIPTGDKHGHGPDPGSTEWRYVIEFKLGIRGDPTVPAVESEQWCDFIDEHYIKARPQKTG